MRSLLVNFVVLKIEVRQLINGFFFSFFILIISIDIVSKTITSRSKPSAFPSALRSKRSAVQNLTSADKKTTALIQETCPQCGRTEMTYYTLQLRSADEGTTVFYSCECGYKSVSCNMQPSDELILSINTDSTQTIEIHIVAQG